MINQQKKNKLKTPGYFIKRLKDNDFVTLRIFDKYSDSDPRKWTVLVDPKGSSVYIEGQLQTNSYEDKNTGEKKYSTQIVARDMQMLGSRNNSETQSNSSEESSMDQTPMDDEIPF